jgi:hypothetical protein
MPCTLPVPVVLAGASSGPVCNGTPSKPIAGCDALDVVPVLPDVLVLPDAAVPVPVDPAEPELELEFDEPHAARARAQASAVAVGIRRRIGSAKVAGCVA